MTAPAPAGGYAENPAKTYWRHQAYQFSDWNAYGRKKCDRVVVCLESSEGCEVRHALSLGFTAERIHAVNDNPAILAHLTRGLDRDRLPRVQVHTGNVGEIAPTLGPIDVLSLDFTGPATEQQLTDINSAAAGLAHGGIVMVNFLGAREPGSLGKQYCRSNLPDTVLVNERTIRGNDGTKIRMRTADAIRAYVVVNAVCRRDTCGDAASMCRWHPVCYRIGRYFSGPLPYLWVVFQVVRCNLTFGLERVEQAVQLARETGCPLSRVLLRDYHVTFPFGSPCHTDAAERMMADLRAPIR